MAKDSDDCEFWLPPQFLTDDDDLFAELKSNKNGGTSNGWFSRDCKHEFSLYGGFGPLGTQSDLSSPVDGSTETVSDDEEFVNELNSKLVLTTLRDSGSAHENRKGWSLSGSPQSTLCSALGGCEYSQGSSRGGSPIGHSRVSSPPKMTNADCAFDLLKAAAGEVARMRLREGGVVFPSTKNGLCGPPRKPSPISVTPKCPCPNLGFAPNQPHISYQHLKAAQHLKQQQLLKHHVNGVWRQQGKYQLNQNQTVVHNRGRIGSGKPNLSMSAWPTLERSTTHRQQPGAGMRAVFLGNTSSKRECAGTGVFLPRRFGTSTETCKKPGCSTVLLPDRVVQALNNLNWVATDGQVHDSRYTTGLAPDYEADLRHGNGTTAASRPRYIGKPQSPVTQELRLPREWTY